MAKGDVRVAQLAKIIRPPFSHGGGRAPRLHQSGMIFPS